MRKRPTSRLSLKLSALVTCGMFGLIGGGALASPLPPAPAAAAGYRLETFATNGSFSPRTVDTRLTFASGYQWYLFNFYGTKPEPALVSLNADGSATVSSFGNEEATMASAAQISAAPYFRGTAFGGGAYFEATLAFDAKAVNLRNGWPAWWTVAVEDIDGGHGDQWPGQPAGYDNFAEPDIFEYDQGPNYPNAYFGSMHEWYGLWAHTCAAYCEVSSAYAAGVRMVPAGTNFAAYHRYGMLWIPATATKKGSLTYYFDGVQTGQPFTYSQFNHQPPPPTANTPWAFGVLDNQHLVLILGSGASTPLQVRSVSVWQASAAKNVHN
ncbi:MAG: hypothetical protein ACRDQZ_20905 [Mycobacteriales bacterium]